MASTSANKRRKMTLTISDNKKKQVAAANSNER